MATQRSLTVLSAQLVSRRGLAELFSAKGWRVTECASLAQVSPSARSQVVIVDLDHWSDDAPTLLAQARKACTGTVIAYGSATRQAAALTSLDDVGIETKNLDANAFGKLTEKRRASSELGKQFRLWQRITPRQRLVMKLLAVGNDNRSIANRMGVGERAIKAHVSGLLALFGLDNRTELALLAADAGLRP
ncbi:MAG: helix-turn-helix transcriptional regulator [Kofleriaceae bacterium]